MQNVFRLGRTVLHFKSSQLGNKFQYQLVKFCYDKNLITTPRNKNAGVCFLNLIPSASSVSSYKDQHFIFLNKSKKFDGPVDWNFKENGKLWNIRLNSFDYLNHLQTLPSDGKSLLLSFINSYKKNKTRFDAHCASLRIINAIKFCSRFKIDIADVNSFLYSQAVYVRKNSEAHLKNNHFLENGFALLFASHYFSEEKMHVAAKKLLSKALREQILNDGAHFELCPMYHLWVVNRLLESLQILRASEFNVRTFEEQVSKVISKMLGWIMQIRFSNGSLPAINDSAEGYGPGVVSVLKIASELNIQSAVTPMKESGFRKFRNRFFEMLVDVNGLTPSESPGHAHADTFHFMLHVFGDPFIIDTGVSTYDVGPVRLYERSTMAHNTVAVGNKNQSEVYGTFRAGRRASVTILKQNVKELVASHDGYSFLGARHTRKFVFENDRILIHDKVDSRSPVKCASHLHIDKRNRLVKRNESYFSKFIKIEFFNSSSTENSDNFYSPVFGSRLPCTVIKTYFTNEMTTVISLLK